MRGMGAAASGDLNWLGDEGTIDCEQASLASTGICVNLAREQIDRELQQNAL